MKKKILTLLVTGILTGALVAAGGCGNSGDAAGSAASAADEEDGDDEDDVDDEDLDGEDIDFDDEDLDFEEAPFDAELETFLDANTGEELLKSHDNILFTETLNGTNGAELYSYDMFVSRDQMLVRYSDGTQEFSNGDNYDGFDATDQAPYRYAFYDEDSREDQKDVYDEFIYFWPGEGAEEKVEDGDEVTFSCFIRDASMLDMLLYEQDEEAGEGDYANRQLTFRKDTMEFISGTATYYKADGTSVQIGECTMSFDTDPLAPDQELLDKLNSEDAHTLTLTLDPGTEEETVITASVGKGCTFYPVIPEGYTFYTDQDLKTAAPDDIWMEKNEDMTLFGVFEEEEDLDGEELEIDEDDFLDLDDLDFDEDDGDVELTEEELQELLENGGIEG